MTYCALGVVFGLVGRSLFLAGIQRWASIVLGVGLLVGLGASRKMALWHPATALVGWLKSRMSGLLRERSLMSLVVLGLLNGLLPCGLVYVACAGATSTNGIIAGAVYMCAFGIGTVPMILGIGLSSKLLPISLRMQLHKAIPVSVCVLATLLILRGLSLGIPYVSPDLSLGGAPCCHK
jgi:sulfite exporter TauE/SafE